jgi:predicted aminopeptidase
MGSMPTPASPLRRRLRALPVVAAVLLVIAASAAGCSTMEYYAQSIHGHFAVLEAARPIPEVIADPKSPPPLRHRLERAQQIRRYASDELALPDNGSYTRYADLHRPYVVWNVFAAPELSLQLKQWCYPVIGCAGYRGYFGKDSAERAAEALRAEGYEVHVSGVPAYSTLGWFQDPLLNTFIGGTEGQLAGLVFHELAHQVVYVGGDTTFNESFATAVEREGVRRWLASHGNDASRQAYAEFAQRRAQFLELLLKYRRLLEETYASEATDDAKRARKQQLLAELSQEYVVLKASWGGFSGYDRFFGQKLTNAHLAAVGAYNDLVPSFDALLAQAGGDFPRFYVEVKRIAAMSKDERNRTLQWPQSVRN